MRVLLTGHQGYLGSVMVPALRAEGHDVVGLDSGLFAGCLLGPAPADPPSVDVDLRDVTEAHLAGFDAVIHLAALSNDPLGSFAPDVTYDINHHGSVRLARLAKTAGVQRFLYASTCSVYGSAGEDLVTESAPLRPLTPYAESKVRVEDDVAAIADSGFSPVFLRNATAFGFSPRLRADIVLNNLVGIATLTGTVRVLSDGTPWRPLVHARDIAAAFCAALTAPTGTIHCRAYNVGTEANNVTVAQIAEAAAAAVPGSTVALTGETGPDPRSYRVDFSAIRTAFEGYAPQWTVADGAVELYDNYVRWGLTDELFTTRFTRLAHLQALRTSGVLDESLRFLRIGAGHA
ncbi:MULTISPECIES: NAD(P)-dependent oxidoreductase [unclassified Rhodococcus (in: high G+C Gram-positive bacteria)]|uniref:NAD-dependent epimerase/dehydratase family protein n=1 Tax=unclassified Rhodococcus (in: high G+C Gram-positive bacteria) TaxID=192944 RepID=UPI00163B5641|nr:MULTISPECIES: SDR family oxidoreductase [unclassified Rhodococcus (in: high G+C Gram-positive bacteria)]MBC2642985.1 SDR family oxidoreductase [Rhodococcus sp. 3A]MBC2892273.1 SDR family oxidoreductase [Rhodococcus sp. 4CII]